MEYKKPGNKVQPVVVPKNQSSPKGLPPKSQATLNSNKSRR